MREDMYSGVKELYEVVLRAKNPMQFGTRYIEADEPVLYFENVNMAALSERSNPIMARGGWSNMPRVIWEDRSEVQFSLTEGVMSAVSMSILLNASVTETAEEQPIIVSKREGPFVLDENHRIVLEHWPVDYRKKKTFIYQYAHDVAQKKIYGKRIKGLINPLTGAEKPCLELYEDKECTIPADDMKEYLVDYGFEYKEGALHYLIQKERFNGLFSLEGKFYSKDENFGVNTTNILYMPKVRVVSDINLRLGERADPTVSVFNIIGMPEKTEISNNLIMEITRLNSDIDADI
jgi:hypothetical protein